MNTREKVARWLCRRVYSEQGLMTWEEVWDAYPRERERFLGDADELLALLEQEPVGEVVAWAWWSDEDPTIRVGTQDPRSTANFPFHVRPLTYATEEGKTDE